MKSGKDSNRIDTRKRKVESVPACRLVEGHRNKSRGDAREEKKL